MRQLAAMHVRSVLLTSGTLAPLDSFAHELQLPFKISLENPHVIDPSQVCLKPHELSPCFASACPQHYSPACASVVQPAYMLDELMRVEEDEIRSKSRRSRH